MSKDIPNEETPTALGRESQAVQFEFLMTDLDAGLTFVRLAQSAVDDPGKRDRNLRKAEVAYETVGRLMSQVVLSDERRRELAARLEELREAINAVG
jgi:hypothetical protein